MTQDKDDHPNRPQNTAFKQQRLKAWQPILTPRVIIVSFLLVGIAFVVIGWVLDEASKGVIEYRVRYDGFDGSPIQDDGQVLTLNNNVFEASFDGCKIDDDFSFEQEIGQGEQKDNCFVEISIKETMDGTVYVYYELDHFYQNHRRYVSSRVDIQLRGEETPDYSLCTPLEKRSDLGPAPDGESAKLLNPCGLIAYSLFNDTIGPPTLIRNNTASDVKFTYDGIAWESDVENKFLNFESSPTDDPNDCNRTSTSPLSPGYQSSCYIYPDPTNNFYLYEAYPFSVNKEPYCQCEGQPVSEACIENNGNQGEGCCTLENPNTPEQYWNCGCRNCPFPGKSSFGVEDEHFIVWMRTAGLPNFRKLYMKITEDQLQAGDVLRFPLKTAFPVGSFKGKKSLVISTLSEFGGKNGFLGIAYIVVGSVCLVFSAVFAVKNIINPRKLGDPEALNWKKVA